MRHLEEGTVHAWLDGALGDDEASSVARHAAECADCAAMVAEARGLVAGASRIVAALDVDRSGIIPKTTTAAANAASGSLWRRLRFTPARAAIAATLLVAVGSVFTVRERGRSSSVVTAATESRAMDTMSPPAGAKTAPAPAQVPFQAPTDMSASRQVRAGNGSPKARALSPSPLAPRPLPLSTTRADVAGAGGSAEPQRKQVAGALSDSIRKVANRESSPPAAPAISPVAAPPPLAEQVATRPPSTANAAATAIARAAARPVDTAAREMRVRLAPSAFADARQGFMPSGRSVCYAFTSGVPPWATGVPVRFALDDMRATDSSDARLVVRRVTPEGKVDGPIAGSWWQRLGRDTVRAQVTWARADGRDAVGLLLTRDVASSALKATLRDSSRAEPVAVALSACTP